MTYVNREKAFDMAAEGMTTSEIARKLNVSIEDAISLVYGTSMRAGIPIDDSPSGTTQIDLGKKRK